MQSVEELLKQNQAVQFTPEGYSMYPILDPGKRDQVVVEPIADRIIKRGDVLLYRRDGVRGEMDENGFARGILTLHRVCRVKADGYYFVGDNQSLVEGPIRREQLLGIMTKRVRAGKELSVTNLFYRGSAAVWLLLLPLRDSIKRPIARMKRWVTHKK